MGEINSLDSEIEGTMTRLASGMLISQLILSLSLQVNSCSLGDFICTGGEENSICASDTMSTLNLSEVSNFHFSTQEASLPALNSVTLSRKNFKRPGIKEA